MTNNVRFHIAEIEDVEGNIVEWVVTDSKNEFDASSFDSEELANEEVEVLIDATR